jgi:acylpyruvate hydrolase
MRVATLRTSDGTRAARVDGDKVTVLPFGDVADLLASGPDWQKTTESARAEATLDLAEVNLAPVVTRPEKVLCAGLNYRAHAAEANLELPTHPVLFAKFWRCLIGARDELLLPYNSDATDWEAEIGVVIGTEIRHASAAQAKAAIAGYTVVNDVSMRDWQRRTREMLQGKAWEASTPVGPTLVSGDEIGDGLDLAISCEVDGVVMQDSRTSDLNFSAVEIVEYISQFITLVPGDLIATGTPSGVGGAMKPPVYLSDGQVMVTRIDGIGELVNVCRQEEKK